MVICVKFLHLPVDCLGCAFGNGEALPFPVADHLADINDLADVVWIVGQLPVDGVDDDERLPADGDSLQPVSYTHLEAVVFKDPLQYGGDLFAKAVGDDAGDAIDDDVGTGLVWIESCGTIGQGHKTVEHDETCLLYTSICV